MKTELLPCAHCGTPAMLQCLNQEWEAYCSHPCCIRPKTGWMTHRHNAITAWNTRHQSEREKMFGEVVEKLSILRCRYFIHIEDPWIDELLTRAKAAMEEWK